MLAALLLLATLPASAAEAPPRPGYFAVLGGAGPAFGSMAAFTQETAASPRAEASRSFGVSNVVGLRAGFWVPGSAWGAALEGSTIMMPVGGGELRAWTLSALLLARPKSWSSRRVFPYAGLGFGVFALDARADYRPQTAAALKTMEFEAETGRWTFDARLGVQARAAPRLLLLAEARLTRFDMDRDWTPSTWFGPPARHRNGIRADAVPLLLQAGAAVEF